MAFREELHDCFEKYMAYRASAGFATDTYRSTVPPFLDFCAERYPEGPRITQSILIFITFLRKNKIQNIRHYFMYFCVESTQNRNINIFQNLF